MDYASVNPTRPAVTSTYQSDMLLSSRMQHLQSHLCSHVFSSSDMGTKMVAIVSAIMQKDMRSSAQPAHHCLELYTLYGSSDVPGSPGTEAWQGLGLHMGPSPGSCGSASMSRRGGGGPSACTEQTIR